MREGLEGCGGSGRVSESVAGYRQVESTALSEKVSGTGEGKRRTKARSKVYLPPTPLRWANSGETILKSSTLSRR